MITAVQTVEALTGADGEWLPDATAPGADPNDYGTPYRYVEEGPFVNWARKQRLDAEERHRKALGDDGNVNGVYFTVRKVES